MLTFEGIGVGVGGREAKLSNEHPLVVKAGTFSPPTNGESGWEKVDRKNQTVTNEPSLQHSM